MHTGFQTLPNQWNEFSLIANSNTQTFSFLFNNQPFNSPHPLPFLNSMAYVDGINLRALGTLTSYADFVQVSEVRSTPHLEHERRERQLEPSQQLERRHDPACRRRHSDIRPVIPHCA